MTTRTKNGTATETLHEQVATLRAELAALSERLATEVRTRRLVVVDQAGDERITTDVRERRTSLTVHSQQLPDADFEHSKSAYVEVSAGEGDDDDQLRNAAVECSTGNNSFAVLAQSAHLSDSGDEICENGRLELFQQTRRRGLDGTMGPATSDDIVRLDRAGVTIDGGRDGLTAYAPMLVARPRP